MNENRSKGGEKVTKGGLLLETYLFYKDLLKF